MKKKLTVNEQLDKFLLTKYNNQWLVSDEIDVYVRKSQRLINGQYIPCLDISNVIVNDRKKGIFKKFLLYCESLNKNIYVESVISEILLQKLPEYGYTLHENTIPPSFYKIYEQNQ